MVFGGGGDINTIIDDIQWIDANSLELLKKLASQNEMKGLMLVTTCRDDEITDDHPFSDTVRDLQINKDVSPALKGGDMTIDDGLAFADCEDITPECLDQVSALLSSTMVVFGTLTPETDGAIGLRLRWYGAGVGFRRQLSERFLR